LGYASFAVSFGISVLYLVQDKSGTGKADGSKWLPSSSILDEINYKAIVIRVSHVDLGDCWTGAAWANYAWGTYWSWDQKETWSLITWFLSMLLSFMLGYEGLGGGRKAAILIDRWIFWPFSLPTSASIISSQDT